MNTNQFKEKAKAARAVEARAAEEAKKQDKLAALEAEAEVFGYVLVPIDAVARPVQIVKSNKHRQVHKTDLATNILIAPPPSPPPSPPLPPPPKTLVENRGMQAAFMSKVFWRLPDGLKFTSQGIASYLPGRFCRAQVSAVNDMLQAVKENTQNQAERLVVCGHEPAAETGEIGKGQAPIFVKVGGKTQGSDENAIMPHLDHSFFCHGKTAGLHCAFVVYCITYFTRKEGGSFSSREFQDYLKSCNSEWANVRPDTIRAIGHKLHDFVTAEDFFRKASVYTLTGRPLKVLPGWLRMQVMDYLTKHPTLQLQEGWGTVLALSDYTEPVHYPPPLSKQKRSLITAQLRQALVQHDHAPQSG